jgi:hypothetical protein
VASNSPDRSAELAEQGGRVRADPFLGDDPAGDALELVADVVDGHRQLFAGLPDDAFDEFDAGLQHVIARFRGVLAARAADGTVTDG